MKRLFTHLWGNALYRNSSIFFIGNIVAGVGGYAYQVAMGRMLSVEEYGTLASLVSLFSLLSMPAGALSTAVIHRVAILKGQSRLGVVRFFTRKLSWFFGIIGLTLFLLLIALAPLMREWFHLSRGASYSIFSVTLGLAFLIALWRGILSGLQRFVTVSWVATLESVVKFILAVVLVSVLHGMNGAVLAIVLSMGLSAVLFGRSLRVLRTYPEEHAAWSELPKNFLMVVLWTFAITALSSVDVLIVKRYFSAGDTGLYAALSLIGKIILFASSSISAVLFPMATELYESGNHVRHRVLLWKAMAITVGISGMATLLYALMPKFIIHLIFGGRYDAFASYLYLFGALAGLLAVVQLLATYLLSIQKKLFVIVLSLAPIVEVVLLMKFHTSIAEILHVSLAVFGSLALILFMSFLRDRVPVVPVLEELPPAPLL